LRNFSADEKAHGDYTEMLCLKTYDVAQCSAIGAEYDSQGQARRKSGARRPWLMM
jgi:hypothetical protein